MQDPIGATYYFALLRSIVDDLQVAGRKSFAAGLKPRLQALSNGEFVEARLGFPTFKAFLEAAEQAGVVELQQAPSDLLVLPREGPLDRQRETGTPPSATLVGPGKKIRPDLWRAWIEWSEGLRRYYDRTTDTVVLLVEPPGPIRSEEIDELRRQVAENPTRFVEIPPLGAQATVDAMRAFAEKWPDETDRAAMQRALAFPEPERAAAEFTRLIRLRPPVGAAWHVARMRQVAIAIDEWATRNNVIVEYVVEAPRGRRNATTVQRVQFNEDELRERLVRAVRRMPVADLLRLPIPAEFLLDL